MNIIYGSIVPAFATETTKSSENIKKQVIPYESNLIISGDTVNNKPILILEKVIDSAIDNMVLV